MFSILVLAGSHVFGAQLLLSCFVLAAGAGGALTWIVSKIRIAQFRKMLGLGAVLAVAVATPQILTDVCNFCPWCYPCW